MEIRLAVRTHASGREAHDIVLTAPAQAGPDDLAAGRIAGLLAATLGVRGDTLAVGGRLLSAGDRLGLPPLLDGAEVRLVEQDRWRPPRVSSAVAATELAVTAGPDAGRTLALISGVHVVGRSGADLAIADPALSRQHLRLTVHPSGITVTDLGSENGTEVDGVTLHRESASAAVGSVLRMGNTTMAVRPSRVRPISTAAQGDGTLIVSRAVTPVPEVPSLTISIPAPPAEQQPRRMPWLAALVPLPIAGLLAWFLGPHLLLLGLMSPLMLGASYLSDRWGSRRARREALLTHARVIEDAEALAAESLVTERLWRERAYPDLAAVLRAATTPGSLLWSRPAGDAEGITLRLGQGSLASGVHWSTPKGSRRLPLCDAPVTVDLQDCGSLAIDAAASPGVLDGLIGQLLGLHSPREVHVWTNRPGWSSTPHVRAAAPEMLLTDAGRILRERAEAAGASDEAVIIVILDDPILGSDTIATLGALRAQGPNHRVLSIIRSGGWSAAGAQLTPVAPRGGAGFALVTAGATIPVNLDAVSRGWVGRLVSALTPLRDASGSGTLPASITWTHVHSQVGIASDVESLHHRWATADDGAWVTLGATEDAPCRMDLAAVGPHALIGGTTGSGKSELLRTLVASLAAEHSPEDVAIVLVDYKGGSAFTGLEDLPHIVGLVTDLDPGLTARALTSLRAEIRRREALLATCGAGDLNAYRAAARRPGADLPRLARLVIVVDEFRALADDLPDFVDGLVRLAAVGRSLGIHLVLATQRPAGVVTADMRANLGLRIALRVRDRTDSQDVIESDAAALIPRNRPGRALLRSGAEPLTLIQTAALSPARGLSMISARVQWRDGTITAREFPLRSVTTPANPVAAIAAAAREGNHHPPASPWLPPLPPEIWWHDSDPVAAWALADDPDRQAQDVVSLDPRAMGHTAIAGGIQSGRTTALLSLAAAAVESRGEHVQVYAVLDSSSPAASILGRLPHTGAVVERTDAAAVGWFVDRLSAAVQRQRSIDAEADRPLMLVLIDGWDVLADTSDSLDHGALTDRLLAVLRDGYASGVRAVVAGDRAVLSGRVARACPERLLLRPNDPHDLALVGIPAKTAPSSWPAGRMVRVADGLHLQVLLRTPSPLSAPGPRVPPWRITALPDRIDLASLPAPQSDRLFVAVAGDRSTVSVGGAGQRSLIVLGSPGSGRTQTLVSIAHQALTAGRIVCAVGSAHSSLALRLEEGGLDDNLHIVDWHETEDLIELRRSHPDLVVIADDIDRHLDSPSVPVLEQIADLVERDAGLMVVSGDGSVLAARPRGLGVTVARARRGIILGSPSPLDGDLLGVRLPRTKGAGPGRGWLVAHRDVIPIQIATTAERPMTGVTPRS